SSGAAMVSGVVCAVRFALSRRALPDARAAGATTWSSRRGVRKARCRSGVVFASDDRCRDCALPSSRGGRSRGRNGKAAYVGVQTGKTLSRLEEDQTMIVARIGYRGIALTPGSNYFALLRARLPILYTFRTFCLAPGFKEAIGQLKQLSLAG